ncbi:hypothetical protein D9M69_707010 [compost metagenome]
MKLIPITGPAASGKTTYLRKLAEEHGVDVHVGSQHTRVALERRVLGSAADGVKVLLLDDCTEDQMRQLERLCKSTLAPSMQVYAVRAA